MAGSCIDNRVGRRAILRLAGGASAAALLAACGGAKATALPSALPQTVSGQTGPGQTAGGPSPAASATSGAIAAPPLSGPGTPTSQAALMIPNSGAQLPTDTVKFHWVDSGDAKALFFKPYFAAYQDAHPNIAVTYDPLPFDKIQALLPLGFQNNNAPDVFQLPGQISLGLAIQNGWVRPIDDLIPNFAQWKAAFPAGSFLTGLNVFAGKSYGAPLTNPGGDTSLCYNTDYAASAAFDPKAAPVTWDAFRAAAKKMTQLGGGKYYGIMMEGQPGTRFAAIVSGFARRAAPLGGGGSGLLGDINWQTGEFNYTTDQYLAVIDLLLGLKSDGSIFPGSISLNAAQARAQFAQGGAGMMISGTYNIPQWKQENPSFNFDIVGQPAPNGGTIYPLVSFPSTTGQNVFSINAKTKYPTVAADIFHYLGTKAGNLMFTTLSGGGQRSIYPDVNAQANIDPRSRAIFKTLDDIQRLAPSPIVRNPDWSQVELELKPVTPNFGTVMQGIFTGQIGDPKKAMQDLKDRTDKEMDRAIKAAQAKGAQVSRDDVVFPNWDPMQDYTDTDYAALKK